jgi:hypothetical protein
VWIAAPPPTVTIPTRRICKNGLRMIPRSLSFCSLYSKSRADKARALEQERLFLLSLLDRAVECCPILSDAADQSVSDVSSSDSLHSPKDTRPAFATSDSRKTLHGDMKSMIQRSRYVIEIDEKLRLNSCCSSSFKFVVYVNSLVFPFRNLKAPLLKVVHSTL